jgi:hypothetical protein
MQNYKNMQLNPNGLRGIETTGIRPVDTVASFASRD